MNEDTPLSEAIRLDATADLQTVLTAWHAATVRLEKTHESLRGEVHRLTDELEVKNRELARKNRLADLGQMASHVAHEVRNSLVPVTLYLSLLRRRIADDALALEVLEKIEAGFNDLDVAVNDLLHFTSDRDPVLQTFSLKRFADEVCASLRPQFSAQAIRAVVDVRDGDMVTADRDMLRRAVLNLVLNALDAMPDGGTLTIAGKAGSDGVCMEVSDTGCGMSSETRRRVFEPFFTTKKGGTGLGLAIVERIAASHSGRVEAQAGKHGVGAVFRLYLPKLVRRAAA
jgi:signal transduction histidine kinase